MDGPVYQDEIYITEIPVKPTYIISSKLALLFCSYKVSLQKFLLPWRVFSGGLGNKDPQNPKESWFVLILEKGNARKCILSPVELASKTFWSCQQSSQTTGSYNIQPWY